MKLREASEEFGVPIRVLREILGAGLLPGRKVDGVWEVDAHSMTCLVNALQLARDLAVPEAEVPSVCDPLYEGPPRQLAERRSRSKHRSRPDLSELREGSRPATRHGREGLARARQAWQEVLVRPDMNQARQAFQRFCEGVYGPDGSDLLAGP